MTRKHLVVVGHGMVAQRFIESFVARGGTDTYDVTVVGEEQQPAYDRVHLTSVFHGSEPESLDLVAPGFFNGEDLTLLTGQEVVAIDPGTRSVTTDGGTTLGYDRLVLATGSFPFVPPVEGSGAPGCFVYRTLDDVDAIREWASASHRTVGAVVGGGLLGLEAADALRRLGLETHVVEFAPRLMSVQIDDGGGQMLRGSVEGLGLHVHVSAQVTEVMTVDGVASGLRLADGTEIAADMVVFAAGVRPRDGLARAAELEVGAPAGIVVDDTLATSDPHIDAIGECALHEGRLYGLVAPGYVMADALADRITGTASAGFHGAELSTQLKLLGVDVASFGDSHGVSEGAQAVVFADPVSRVYRKLVLDATGDRLLGGVLVGDASGYATLAQLARGALDAPEHLERLVFPAGAGVPALSMSGMADAALVCSCNRVDAGAIRGAIAAAPDANIGAIKQCTKAGTGCGSCVPILQEMLDAAASADGTPVRRVLCEHFDFTRQELFDIVRVRNVRSFATLVRDHGRGRGCEICKPAVASMLASTGSEYVLDGELGSLQDTNDYALANLQRDGTYSVIPRIPGGEVRPEQLIALGEIALEFDLYTKITGGQRVDLLGARIDELPAIWARLIEAGFESGHAYGKALRTVKSCVGEVWCRYGVQDAVGLAIELELRYRGLRSPHKIKSAVSGCARECAEAQSKDFGIIATEQGWNLYVGGNGGMRPQHAELLATDLDPETLVRYIDRFLMFYIRTADRLERTATWMRKLEGGVEYLRSVVVDDALGIAGELEADMARHVDSYECEWKATLAKPERLARFQHFVNTPAPDPTRTAVTIRGQRVPSPAGSAR